MLLSASESIDKLPLKAKHGFNRLEGEADYLQGPLNDAVICTVALCAFFDFRVVDVDWRAGWLMLAARYDEFAAHASMRSSELRLRT